MYGFTILNLTLNLNTPRQQIDDVNVIGNAAELDINMDLALFHNAVQSAVPVVSRGTSSSSKGGASTSMGPGFFVQTAGLSDSITRWAPSSAPVDAAQTDTGAAGDVGNLGAKKVSRKRKAAASVADAEVNGGAPLALPDMPAGQPLGAAAAGPGQSGASRPKKSRTGTVDPVYETPSLTDAELLVSSGGGILDTKPAAFKPMVAALSKQRKTLEPHMEANI